MKVVAMDPVLECSFDEFWNEYWSKHALSVIETKGETETTLRGESKIKPRYRIPSADGVSEIFFDSREMLCRFAAFPTPTQSHFLQSLRKALVENNVTRIAISIPWSSNGQKRLLVRASGGGVSVLDFEILP